MRRAACVLLLAGLLAPAYGAEPAPQERAFVEIGAGEGPFVVGEAVRIALRIGFDRPWFEAHAVPLFHVPLDVPVQADAPWLREVPDAVAAPAPPDATWRDTATIAVNGRATPARRAPDAFRDGRTFAVLEVERVWRPRRAGEIALAAPTLRFAHATRFRDDLLQGRTALDPQDVVLRGEARTLRVAPVPSEGRPAEFEGAVGRYTVRAEAGRSEVRVGEVFPVRLVVEGEGNLDLLPPPRPGDLPGFHVYGTLDEQAAGRRTLTYDVAALRDDLRAVPPIPFAFYDPEPPGRYRVLRTAPLSLVVHAAGAAPPRPPPAARAPSGATWPVLLSAAVLAAAAAAWGLARRRRARRARERDPDARRRREAEAAFHAAAARPGTDLAEALAGVLAARLRCPPAAVVSPDLRARLVASGVPPDLAARASSALESLVAARYGGPPPDPSAASSVVRDLA